MKKLCGEELRSSLFILKEGKCMMKLILGVIGVFLLLFLYSACVLSSKYSKEEEKNGKTRII